MTVPVRAEGRTETTDRRYLETVDRHMKRRRPENRFGEKTTGLDGPVVFRRW